MGWWSRRGPKAPELVWRERWDNTRLGTTMPRYRALGLCISAIDQTTTPTVYRMRGPLSAAEVPAGAVQEEVLAWFLACELTVPLMPMLVGEDFFHPISEVTGCPQMDLPVPAEDDPYDGRLWRVFAAEPRFAKALLDDELWAWLVEHTSKRDPLTVWIDGRRVMTGFSVSSRRNNERAATLRAFNTLVQERLDLGLLDDFVTPEPILPDKVLPSEFVRRGWHVGPPGQEILFHLWDAWPNTMVGRQVTGTVDGVGFVALETATGGVVLVPTLRPVPDHVHYARKPLVDRGNVHTEWLDFDDDFEVRAGNQQVGHGVTTPRLMAYLHDNRVRRLDVKHRWVQARVKKLNAEQIEEMVPILAGSRDLLPRHDLGAD